MAKKEKEGAGSGSAPLTVEEQLGKLADIMIGKMNPNVQGGAPFVPLSAEEVAKLPAKTMEEMAADYYGTKSELPSDWPGIYVTSDGQIFTGHVAGKNGLDNHIKSKEGLTYSFFPKPQ